MVTANVIDNVVVLLPYAVCRLPNADSPIPVTLRYSDSRAILEVLVQIKTLKPSRLPHIPAPVSIRRKFRSAHM